MRDALDFVRLVDGRAYDGAPERAESWYGFGEPVMAPADGTVVSVSDVHADEPIGATGQTPPMATTSPSRSATIATRSWRTSGKEARG